ncbi:hypothetical protein QQX98_004832 [Neonectria punicea]|uniref:Protein kinase domain-containing protein n=1 Tax=Neonectria punicea TaxID=979145 RepID=A0ABR1H7Q4_9HYPO
MDSSKEDSIQEANDPRFDLTQFEGSFGRRSRDARRNLLIGSHNSPLGPGVLRNAIPQDPTSNTEASIVIDGGDTKQLEHTASTDQESSLWQTPQDAASLLLSGTGDRFSGGLVPSNRSSFDVDPVTQPPEDSTLELRVRVAMEKSMWSGTDNKFLPINERNQIINAKAIKNELKGLNLGSEYDLDEITEQIWGISTFSRPHTTTTNKTTRRKLFTILLLMDKVKTILGLIKEGIHDNDLPFSLDPETETQLQRKLATGNCETMRTFESWRPHECDNFNRYQWQMLAPYWELSSKRSPKVLHYELDERIILPFVYFSNPQPEESINDYVGGFSEVRKVEIHPAHHNDHHPDPCRGHRRFFAVKRLHQDEWSNANFDKEAKNLKRFVDKHHDHLIRLLITFKHGRDYHLVFQWADENLLNYWQKPSAEAINLPRDADSARWIAKQFMGLADGIKLIHECKVEKSNRDFLAPAEGDKIYGRHGDLKPENILWFKNDDRGILQIADFGLTEFHKRSSIQVPASQVGGSRTHRAPEFDAARAVVAPSSDMWSFGCILLEFVAWYLLGWKEVDEFSKRRSHEDGGGVYEDKFFISKPRRGAQISGDSPGAEVKQSVIKEIRKLRELEQCTDFFCDVLDLVENGLLQGRLLKSSNMRLRFQA